MTVFDPFDPVAVAKPVVGMLRAEIKAAQPDAAGEVAFDTALLLQAGFRGLLPAKERKDIAPPPRALLDKPESELNALDRAQINVLRLLGSRKAPIGEHKEAAFAALRQAVKELDAQGFRIAAGAVHAYIVSEGYGSPRPGGLAGSTLGLRRGQKPLR